MGIVAFKEISPLGLLVKKITGFKDKAKNSTIAMCENALLNITVFHSGRKISVVVCWNTRKGHLDFCQPLLINSNLYKISDKQKSCLAPKAERKQVGV